MELLAQSHRHRVLQLGPAHLHNMIELSALGPKSVPQLLDGLDQRRVHQDQRNLRRRGVGVIGGLTLVHVVIGVAELVLALLLPEVLERAVRDHLVGVHVRGGASATLDHVHQEVPAHLCAPVLAQVGALGVDELVAGVANGLGFLLRQVPQLVVRHGARLLHLRQGYDELREVPQQDPRDVVVLHRAEGLHPVVGLDGHLALAQQILLRARGVRIHLDGGFPHGVGREGAVH
mmetsp:Transcript_93860/g.223221  ORF Transcript_93860/g.223221 Transcript_93860/m.223221 type:complete len:233 (-) Transcript_93860:65-763(-)